MMESFRPPLTNRGPSRDQPAPGSPRHIPFDAPEPGPEVTAVAVLEQQPFYERWERIGTDQWRHAGYRGDTSPERAVVGWARVGVCGRGTKHDMKDVTDRRPQWHDRPGDVLPERIHVVTLQIVATSNELRGLLIEHDIVITPSSGGRVRLTIRVANSTLPGAVAVATRRAEAAGAAVVGITA